MKCAVMCEEKKEPILRKILINTLFIKRPFLFVNLLNLSFEISGDLERIKLSLQDSEAEKQTLRERIDDLIKAQHHLEQKATSLQLTVSFKFYSMNRPF